MATGRAVGLQRDYVAGGARTVSGRLWGDQLFFEKGKLRTYKPRKHTRNNAYAWGRIVRAVNARTPTNAIGHYNPPVDQAGFMADVGLQLKGQPGPRHGLHGWPAQRSPRGRARGMAAALNTWDSVPGAGSRAIFAEFQGKDQPIVVMGGYNAPAYRKTGMTQDRFLRAVENFIHSLTLKDFDGRQSDGEGRR